MGGWCKDSELLAKCVVSQWKISIKTPPLALVRNIRITYILHEASRHIHISEGVGLAEEWSYLPDLVPGIAGSDGCKHELVLWVEDNIFRKPLNSLRQLLKRIPSVGIA